MRSPFPGMDPYLEDPAFWQDFHRRFITHCADTLGDQLPDEYEARIDEQVRLVDMSPESDRRVLPDVAVIHDPMASARASPVPHESTVAMLEPVAVPMPFTAEVRDTWIEILHRPERSLVTVIELLSPSNKTGAGFGEYLSKRRAVLEQHANLVEMDLLVGGQRMPLLRQPPRGDYYTFVVRDNRRPYVDVYAWGVRNPLPPIPIPLRHPSPDVPLNLATVVNHTYERGRYAPALCYDGPPRAPLSPEDARWAEELAAPMRGQKP